MVEETTIGLWRGAKKIYHILLEKEATWSEVKRETGFSGTILSRYLRDLQDRGLVFKNPTDGKYRTYEKAYQTFEQQMLFSVLLSHESDSFKNILKVIRSGEGTKAFEERAIRAYVMLLTATIPALIYSSLRGSKNPHQRIDDLIELSTRPWIHRVLDLCLLKKDVGERITVEVSNSLHSTGLDERAKYLEMMKRLS